MFSTYILSCNQLAQLILKKYRTSQRLQMRTTEIRRLTPCGTSRKVVQNVIEEVPFFLESLNEKNCEVPRFPPCVQPLKVVQNKDLSSVKWRWL